jgi:hypothetical protein
MCPLIALSTTTASIVIFRLHPNVGGSPAHPAESSSFSCGPTVRFQLLPTPPRGDAVTFSYRAVAYSGMDFHHADKSPSWAHNETAPRQLRFFSLFFGKIMQHFAWLYDVKNKVDTLPI